jgi:soluble lytic murein transglycosylase-like protein
MKNGLSYFEEGKSTGVVDDVPVEQTITPLRGAAAKKAPLDPTQTADLLANMQAMINSRQGPMASLNRGLERAAAWGSGGIQGPSAALNQLNRQQAEEEKSTFDMRQQMAAYRAAQERQRRGAETLGFGVQPAAQPSAQSGAQPSMPSAAPAAAQPAYLTMLNSLPASVRPAGMMALQNGDFDKFSELVSVHEIKRPDIQKNLAFAETLPTDQKDLFGRQAFKEAYGPQTYVDAEGRSFQYSLPQAMPPEMRNQPRPAAPAPAAGGTLSQIQNSVFQTESSSGKADTSKPGVQGAIGPMQITQDTWNTNTARGVIPKNLDINNPRDNKLAGDKLLEHYYNKFGGDVDKTLAAYHGGEGAINPDGTINTSRKDANGMTIGNYIAKNKAQIVDTTAAQPVQRKSMGELETEKTYKTGLAEGAAKNAIEAEKEFRKTTEAKSVAERKTSAERVITLVQQYPQATGVLAKEGVANALLTIARDGINTPSGAIGVRAIEDALVLTMPGTSQNIINARKEIAQNLARAALETSKLSQGQGAVSDYERSLFERVSGSLADTPELLIKRQQMLVARADLDQKLGNMYRLSKVAGKPTDYEAFTTRTDVVNLIDKYENQLRDILGSEARVGKQGAPAIPKYDAQKEARYQQWKNSQGNKQ